jgi:hypothetical protein
MIGVAQGVYYLATGLWAVVHYRSFSRVTGPKTDVWLVKTTGLILAGIGLVLLLFYETEAAALLGLLIALTLAGADTFYSIRGTISKIYMADAAVELGFAAGWALTII